MTTTLETVVLPVLKQAQFMYEVSDNGTAVLFVCNVPRFTSHWTVVDHTKPHVLSIEAGNIVSFVPDTTDILQRLNELNAICTGKFWLVDQEHLKYSLELPYIEDMNSAILQHGLFLALDTVATSYQGWCKQSRRQKTLIQQVEEIFGSAKPDANQRR